MDIMKKHPEFKCYYLVMDTLFSRISEACNKVTHKDLHGYIRHSISCFDDCLNGAPI